jgi:hypothetical protein
MTCTVKNVGALITSISGPTATAGGWKSGLRETDPKLAFAERGTVRVVFEGLEYVFGPNESKSFADDGVAAAVAAADSRLRVTDERDGGPNIYYANPSLPTTHW